MYLGDRVESVLSAVGITRDRVERWVGPECGCEERKEKLNTLDQYARRYLSGKIHQAKHYLERLVEEPPHEFPDPP
jgi:hypothetical protein